MEIDETDIGYGLKAAAQAIKDLNLGYMSEEAIQIVAETAIAAFLERTFTLVQSR